MRDLEGLSHRPATERGGPDVIIDGQTHLLRAARGPANYRAYLPLMYYRSVLNGEGRLDAPMNDRYPSIRPTRVSEYVVKEGL